MDRTARLVKVGNRGQQPAAKVLTIKRRMGQRSRRHNNQLSMEGCSSGIGGNNNGYHDDKSNDGGMEGCEDQ